MEIAEFVAALPKTQLHLHLIGSAAPETVLTLARRHPDGGVPGLGAERIHRAFGLTTADLAGLARAGARAAFCPEPTRRAILAEINQLEGAQ